MQIRLTSILVLASTWLSLAAGSFAQEPGPYFYYYLGEPISLGETLDAMAVFDRARGPVDPLQRLVEEAAVPDPQVKPHPIGGGWFTVRFNSASVATPGVSSLIARLIEHDAVGRFFFSPVFIGPSGAPVIVPPDILLQFDPNVGPGDVARLLRAGGLRGGAREPFTRSLENAFKVRTNERSGIDVLTITNRLAEMDQIIFAEPNMIVTGRSSVDELPAELVPTDPEFEDSWGLNNTGQFPGAVPGFDIKVTKAWGLTLGDPSVKTVILDVGVDQGHTDINQLPGRDFTNEVGNGGPINECDNHGTPVAGVISGKAFNNIGTVGVAPQTRIVSARVFISDTILCDGSWNTQFRWTADAIDWAMDTGARITVNSNWYGTESNSITMLYEQTSSKLFHIASAGNQVPTVDITFPAKLNSVSAVTGMDWDGGLYATSSRGPEAAFTAPGRTILTTDRQGSAGWSILDTTFATGTSFAAPMVAGIVALVLSVDASLLPAEILDILIFSARDLGNPGQDIFFGHGLVETSTAVKLSAIHMIFSDGFESGDMSFWLSEQQ